MHKHSFLWWNNVLAGCKPASQESEHINKHATTYIQERIAVSLWFIQQVSKFSPKTIEVCEPVQKLTPVKAD